MNLKKRKLFWAMLFEPIRTMPNYWFIKGITLHSAKWAKRQKHPMPQPLKKIPTTSGLIWLPLLFMKWQAMAKKHWIYTTVRLSDNQTTSALKIPLLGSILKIKSCLKLKPPSPAYLKNVQNISQLACWRVNYWFRKENLTAPSTYWTNW